MARYLGHSILKIALINNSTVDYKKIIETTYDEIKIVSNANKDFNGLIVLSNEITEQQKNLIYKSEELGIPKLGMMDGFDGLNIFFGGRKSVEVVEDSSQCFLSPGAKLSHIIGGSGWIKINFQNKKLIFIKDLSERFFPSIISDKGEIIGFEKAGDLWEFGLRVDLFSSQIPKGFNNIFYVFLDKCSK